VNNKSIKYPVRWQKDGLKYKELIRQEYKGNGCIVRAGLVTGHNKPPVDTMFLRLEKDGVEPTTILLRPDELQAIAWCASGAIWSHLINIKNNT